MLYPFAAPDATPIGNGSPNSNALIVEADRVPLGKEKSLWRPLMNLKLGAQYTAYTEFNGAEKKLRHERPQCRQQRHPVAVRLDDFLTPKAPPRQA